MSQNRAPSYFFRTTNAPGSMAAAGADLLGAKAPKHLIFQPPYHLNPTMSAALKDDIKSAMSGVGVTLSGDMLSKCEFLRGAAAHAGPLYLRLWENHHVGPAHPPKLAEPNRGILNLGCRRDRYALALAPSC